MRRTLLLTVSMLAGLPVLLADFSYQQTATITGGMMKSMMRVAGAFSKQAREPMVSTIFLKGNRMATVHAQFADVVDLDKENMTHIDFAKKTYSVTTFAEMRQAMEEAMQKMEGQKASAKDPNTDVNFRVSATPTGQKRTINGFDAKEMILNIAFEATDNSKGTSGAMNVRSDLWLAPGIQGYEEVRDFQRRLAQKLAIGMPSGIFGGMAQNPQMMKGMAQLAAEMSKVEGMPVYQTVSMGGSATGVPQDGASTPPQPQPQTPSGGEVAGQAASGAATSRMGRLGGLAGMAGGLGGFGRRKKTEEQPQTAPQAAASPSNGQPVSASASLMEMTIEASNFSNAPVDASKFDAPAGFQQVEPPRRGRAR